MNLMSFPLLYPSTENGKVTAKSNCQILLKPIDFILKIWSTIVLSPRVSLTLS